MTAKVLGEMNHAGRSDRIARSTSGRRKPAWDFLGRNQCSREMREYGPGGNDQSGIVFGPRKISRFCFGYKHLCQARMPAS